jgi:MoxR-like ATPase
MTGSRENHEFMEGHMKPFLAVNGIQPLRLSAALTERHRSPGGYILSDELHAAMDAAMLLGIPLLLTGDPGTGKTQAARWLSDHFGEDRLLRCDVKSTMSGRDLLYRFDEVARFRDSSAGGTPRPLIEYLEFEALGEAIVRAIGGTAKLVDIRQGGDTVGRAFGKKGQMKVSDLLPDEKGFEQAGPTARVVLIDELDKAPRDTPNDLLAEIEDMAFNIPELGVRVEAAESDALESRQRPIVIITSNSEKALPEPFLRRCAFFHIPFPENTTLSEIVKGALPKLKPGQPLFNSAVEFLLELRERTVLEKPPGTSEFLAWGECLVSEHLLKLNSSDSVFDPPENLDRVKQSLGCLVKTGPDLVAAQKKLDHMRSQKSASN